MKVVKGLKQDAKIVYFDKTSEFTRARDLLDRYDNLSAKLTVDYSDPDKKPQLAKAEGVRSYGTTFVQANGKKEEAKSLTEEEITGALIRALKGGARNVCAVSGSDEHGLADSERSGFSGAKDLMERNNYKTRSISLLEKPEVPKDCTVLVIGGPRFDYVQPAVDAIKAYVESGGRALFLLDPPLKLGKERHRRQRRTGQAAGELGRDPEQGSGAGRERHRQDLRAGSRGAADHRLPVASDRS